MCGNFYKRHKDQAIFRVGIFIISNLFSVFDDFILYSMKHTSQKSLNSACDSSMCTAPLKELIFHLKFIKTIFLTSYLVPNIKHSAT